MRIALAATISAATTLCALVGAPAAAAVPTNCYQPGTYYPCLDPNWNWPLEGIPGTVNPGNGVYDPVTGQPPCYYAGTCPCDTRAACQPR